MRVRRTSLVGLLALALAAPAAVACKGNKKGGPTTAGAPSGSVDDGEEIDRLEKEEVEAIGKAALALLEGQEAELPEVLVDNDGSVFIALRVKGEEVAEVWGDDGNLAASFKQAMKRAKESAGGKASEVDGIEIDIAHNFEWLEEADDKGIHKKVGNKRRGVRGIEFSHPKGSVRWAPTQMLADNLKFAEVHEAFRKANGLSDSDMSDDGRARMFEAEQVWVQVEDGSAKATRMFRGNTYWHEKDVTQASTKALATTMGDWLIRHVRDDGRMTYMWYPGTSTEGEDNNMIRQWMATNCLVKIAYDRDDQAVFDLVEKNIDYNLEHFYKEDEEGYGWIEYRGTSKLGGISLATMALVLHPKREKWASQEAAMRKTIDRLWHEDGSFDAFYKPRQQRGGANVHNFYPGETLLLWSTWLVDADDPELLARFMKSFEYYRKWHINEPPIRKPSFTPWHSQAYYNVWTKTKDPELQAFVFEMNDWLIQKMAQWDKVVYQDEKGRFYSRKHHKDGFGPPHASSTGVYIEGLIDAYRMAKEVGDEDRTELYRRTLARALRSMNQLQFQDEVDMFYVTDKDMARGGMRTSVFRSEIRVDNVQHGLMGIIKLIQAFGPDDYGTD